MDFKGLTYIIAIAKYQNITKAANSLYLSQPTLTKFLQNLEKNLGQKLFVKVNNKFKLTYAGERYVAKAQEILQLKKDLDVEMADIINSRRGVLDIAFPHVRGEYMIPCTLPIFKSLYPNVKLNVHESASSSLENMLLSGTTDLAFFNAPVKDKNIDYEIISNEEIVLIMSKKHPLANSGIAREGYPHPWIDLRSINDELFIIQKPGQRTRQIVDKYFKENNIELRNVQIFRNIRAAAKLATTNYGLAFICDTHLKHMDITNDIQIFSCGNPCINVDFVVAYRKGTYISYYAREYIKIVKDFT